MKRIPPFPLSGERNVSPGVGAAAGLFRPKPPDNTARPAPPVPMLSTKS